MTNSVDPDQSDLDCTVFAYAILADTLMYKILEHFFYLNQPNYLTAICLFLKITGKTCSKVST